MIQKIIDIYQKEGAVSLARASKIHLKERANKSHWKIDEKSIPLVNRHFNMKYGTGESILDRNWDNLILYDACRYDEFIRVSPFCEDKVECRITLGSKTPEFLQKTFDRRSHNDIVYVTANPQVIKYVSECQETPFHATISLLDRWDSSIQTIPPEAVKTEALRVESEYPNKRLIIHFLQPHAPFIGPKASEIRKRTSKTIGGLDPGRSYTELDSQSIETTSYHGILQSKNVSVEDIRTAYQETLSIATKSVIGLAEKMNGKTAITSDHGELLGDRLHPFGVRRWEHPIGIRTPELCFVPWVEWTYNNRKRISEGSKKQSSQIDQELIDKRLRSLGYVQK